MSLEIAPTLEMVLRVRPRTPEVVVVSGSAKLDRDWNAVARADFRPFESRIKVTFWDGLPFAELTKRARALPPETAMFYLTYLQEPDGTPLPSSARALQILAANCSAPIFGIYDTELGKGIVGGQMTDFAGEGAAVGRVVQRILAGEALDSIGVQPPRPALFYFDARQLDRWGIPESVLPAGSQVLFREPSLWETHRNAVLLALAVISAQAALILLLLAARRRAREMDANLSLAADAANVGLWHRNAATNQIKASPKWRTLFGLPMTGKITMDEVMKRLPAEDEAGVRKAIEGAAIDGQSYSMEHRVVFPDGGTRWIASHGRADTGPNGQLVGTRGASMDITERKQAEEKFRLAVEASPSGIVMFDSHGKILLVNAFAEKLFGFAADELPGQPIDALLPERLCELYSAHRGNVVNGSEAGALDPSGELFARRKDGSKFAVEIGFSMIHTDEGELTLCSVIDVTERRRTAMELDQQRQELAHLSRVASLGVLSGALAHELNQPLGIILSNAQAAQHLLSDEQPDLDELRAILEDIVAEDRRAGDVIKRLRALLRRGESALEPIDVNENLKEILKLTRSDLIRRGVLVVCHLDDDLPAATSDRVQLQQVLLNLITNACDAMETNPPAGRLLTLTTFLQGNEIYITVQDCGIGLPEDLETMFKPFHTTKAHGLGMGLAICRTLVAAHGGRLWAQPNADHGAAFYVALAVAREGP
jgi:PAS domain S-box-containing protein